MKHINRLQLVMVLILGAAMGYVAATNLGAGGNRAEANSTVPAIAKSTTDTSSEDSSLDYCRCFEDSGRAAELADTHDAESQEKTGEK